MTTEEIKDELYRMLSDVVNGGYPKRTYAQQARYKEAVKRTVDALDVLEEMSHSEEPNKWIPLTKRPLTVKECGEYVEGRTFTETMLLNCPLPKDGQWVLISHSDGYVHTDIFHNDEGACYFEGFDIDEVEAWMPLPLPYRAESEDKE